MAVQVQFRRGTKAQHDAFTGATAEVTVNTTDKTLVVHDGTTQGGFAIARADGTNLDLTGLAGVTTVTSVAIHGGTINNTTIGIGTSANGNFTNVNFVDGQVGSALSVGAATTFKEMLVVNGDARVTGILTVGTSSIIIDGDNERILFGGSEINGDGNINASTGIATYLTVDAGTLDAGANLYAVAGVVTTLTSTNATTADLNVTADARVGSALTVTGNTDLNGNLTVQGNLDVQGSVTTIESTTVTVDDKNIELGSVDSPSDATANGGGITLKGATDKTITWQSDTGGWEVNQDFLPSADGTHDLGASGQEWQDLWVDGTANIDSLVADTADINAGTIDGTTIGGSSAAEGTFTNLTAADANITADARVGAALTVTGEVTFQSNVNLGDNDKAIFGNGFDLEIFHDGNDSYIFDNGTGRLRLTSQGTGVDIIKDNGEILATFNTDGAVSLYYDNSKKFETTAYGVDVTGTTGTDNLAVSGVSTFTGEATFQSNVNLGDNDRLRLGDGNDLQIYHDGGNSLIVDSGVGDLYIAGDNSLYITNTSASETKASFNTNGSVDLYYDSSKTFETTAYGIDVTGTTGTDGLAVSGVSTFTGQIDGNGGADISGGETTLSSATVSDLTSGRVVLAGTSGALEDSSNLTFNGTTLSAPTADLTNATIDNLTFTSGTAITSVDTDLSSVSASDDTLASAKAIKSYVDSQVTAQDLDIAGDSGTGAVDLDSQTFTIAGTSNEIETSVSGQTVTIGLPNDVTVSAAATIGGALTVSGEATFQANVNLGDNDKIVLGDGGDLEIFYNGTNSIIKQVTAGDLILQSDDDISIQVAGTENAIVCNGNGSVDIRHNNIKKLETTAYGIDVTGTTGTDGLAVSGVSTFTGQIDGNGGANISGGESILSSATVSDLTSGRVVLAGTSGALEDSANLTFNGTTLSAPTADLTNATIDNLTFTSGTAITSVDTDLSSVSGTDNSLASAKAIKTYVDAQITAQDLDFAGGTGTGAVDLDSQTLTIAGTANEIETSASGQTLTIGLPNDVTIGQDLTIGRDVLISRNLNVTGNVTIGGTSATIFASELKVADADIVLGIRTDESGNDISNDTTADHGGVAVASTEGTPLVSLYNPGIGESNPATYKKIMWFKTGSFSGLGTDAWLSNYAIGIGSTQVPNNVVLAAGAVNITNNDISYVRDVTIARNSTVAGTFGVTGQTTLTGLLDANGGATIDNVRIGVAGDNEIDTSTGNLTIDSAGGTTTVDDNLGVTGNFVANNNVDLGDSTNDTITATGRFDSDLVPSTDSARDLGSTSLRWAEVWSDQVVADNIQIGVTGTNEIDTASGNLTIDSAGGTTTIDDALSVTGNISGNLANTLTLNTSGTGLSGSQTYNNSGAATFTVTSNATNSNTASTIVARDGSGNFSAGTITATLSGTATNATNITLADESSDTTCFPVFATTATGNQAPKTGSNLTFNSANGTLTATTFSGSGASLTSIPNGALDNSTISGVSLGSNLNTLTMGVSGTGLSGSQTYNGSGAATFTVTSNATNSNTASTIVARDASGNFSAGTITAALSGNATTATTATNANNINVADESSDTTCNVVFTTGATGNLAPKTGTNLTFNSSNGTLTATTFSGSGASLTSIPNSALTNSTISGVSLGSNLNTLTMNVSGTGLSGSQTYNGSGAATFTVTSNATSANTASAIVARDGSGNFSAGTITATLSGNASTATSATSATTATNANNINLADESSDTTCFPVFATSATGNQAPKTGSNLTFNSSNGTLAATTFSGSGASLTSLNASNISSGTINAARVPTLNQNTTGSSGSCTGNAATATTLQTARTINGVSFNGSANITVEPYIENDESTNATRYMVFTDNSTAGHKRLNEDSSLTYNPSTNILSAGQFNATSDIKLKENITTIESGLDKVCQLRGVEFDFKSNGQHSLGVIAQEVEQVLPDLVSEVDGTKTVAYANLTAVLIEAVKELKAEVAELRSRLDG